MSRAAHRRPKDWKFGLFQELKVLGLGWGGCKVKVLRLGSRFRTGLNDKDLKWLWASNLGSQHAHIVEACM